MTERDLIFFIWIECILCVQDAERFEDLGGAAASGPQSVMDGVDPPEHDTGNSWGYLAGGRGRRLHRSSRPRFADYLLTRGGPSQYHSNVAWTHIRGTSIFYSLVENPRVIWLNGLPVTPMKKYSLACLDRRWRRKKETEESQRIFFLKISLSNILSHDSM